MVLETTTRWNTGRPRYRGWKQPTRRRDYSTTIEIIVSQPQPKADRHEYRKRGIQKYQWTYDAWPIRRYEHQIEGPTVVNETNSNIKIRRLYSHIRHTIRAIKSNNSVIHGRKIPTYVTMEITLWHTGRNRHVQTGNVQNKVNRDASPWTNTGTDIDDVRSATKQSILNWIHNDIQKPIRDVRKNPGTM